LKNYAKLKKKCKLLDRKKEYIKISFQKDDESDIIIDMLNKVDAWINDKHDNELLIGNHTIDNLPSFCINDFQNNIFIFKTAHDILYMNDSFKSEAEEISRLLLKSNVEHNDDLELF
jgi:hypothetical protein